MSTRRKEGTPAGKEKRGTSPSNAGGGKRSPASSKTNDSNPSGKSIPSYLKPTAASTATDASKLQSASKKKPSLTADKATIERRRSFDKPPSPSRSTKSPNPTLRSSSSFSGKTINDTPSASVARRRSFDKPPSPSRSIRSPVSPSPAVRSSSFSGKLGGGLNKGASERNSKGTKDALYARPASSVLTKKPVASSPGKVENPELDEQECFVGEEEEPGYSLLEDEDVNNIIEQIEGECHENDAVIVAEQNEASTVVIESPRDVEIQEDKTGPVEDSTDIEHEDKSQDETTNEMNHSEDGKNEEEAIQVDNGGEPNDQLAVEEKKEEQVEDSTPNVAHGKKDLTLSNDVIEETRNKLVEQRRNRVKALAGAFETVISLQDK